MRLLSAVIFVAFVSGCHTPPPLPVELQYKAPSSKEPKGSIIGSIYQELLGYNVVFVRSVNGKRVDHGSDGWQNKLGLALGKQKLLVELERGLMRATATLFVDVEPGSDFGIQHSARLDGFTSDPYCDFWIVDLKSGKAVSEIVRATIHIHKK